MSIPITIPAQWRFQRKNFQDIKSQEEYELWRTPPTQPDVTFYLDAHVAEFSPERTVRWAILGSGRVASGPGSKLLHADMMLGTRALGEGDALAIGFVLYHRGSWVMALVQPIGLSNLRDQRVQELCERLHSWDAFVQGERLIWPEPGEGAAVMELLDKKALEKP